ncbi:MAG: HAD family hydrolase [Spirochaetaceae bacterium]|jgi:putative hydrolase of the HAD superfamily|nr:HAD family hydrolase [Spirochaetaceae bacterium]
MYEDFTALIRDSAHPLPPLPAPPLPPDYEALVYPGRRSAPVPGIRALIFDVYGTLFSSAAGDIGAGGAYIPGNLDSLALQFGKTYTGEELKEYFRSEVLKIHTGLFAKTPYPEVRVEEIWDGFLRKAPAGHPPGGFVMSAEELALRYELMVNPVSPMPGALETIRILKEAGVVLGIISNAQFFTPLLFDALLGASPAGLGFDQDILIYSYETGEAKPSPVLFAKAGARLSTLGISPEAVLYVGNDMLNDIYAASSVGFKTLLFAGDGRSLRLREGNRLVRNVRPDAVIRSLAVIPALCGFPQIRYDIL